MAYDEDLDRRITEAVEDWPAVRKKMFGGTCHLLNGNMVCGVLEDRLILRLGERAAGEALAQDSVQPFDITGRPMKGWVMVEKIETEGAELHQWLKRARAFVETLPPK